MLRIFAILTLLFYLTISFGVHVDIDTCCKSVSGLSLISESDETVDTSSNCCPSEKVSCCASDSEKGCELNRVFIQVLSEEQVASTRLQVNCAERLLFDHAVLEIAASTALNAIAESDNYRAPPLIPMDEDKYLVNNSRLTYG